MFSQRHSHKIPLYSHCNPDINIYIHIIIPIMIYIYYPNYTHGSFDCRSNVTSWPPLSCYCSAPC